MKRTIEIDDTLQERVDDAIEAVKDCLIDYLTDNPDVTDTPCINNDLDYAGTIHEIIDSAVPIYTNEIEGLWYLYKDEFVEAYDNVGFGDNPLENNGMTAIYCYLNAKVDEWYESNATDVCGAWYDAQEKE